jgi:hypothetical protein
MAKKKSSKSKSKSKSHSTKAAAPPEKKAPQPKIYICPYTEQNVHICRATLKDLKSKSTYSNTSGKKRLWMLTSSQTRHEHYAEAALSIASMEQSLLPSFGGRSWEVTCNMQEPSGQVLFRAWKGSMELAVLPHLMEKIPKPPVWPGRGHQTPDEYIVAEEDDDNKGLQDREISTLSSVAWGLQKEFPVPSVTVKYKSPDYHCFTSRKAAWEHATEMAAREVQIHKQLLGIGASGKFLQPFWPSAPMALKVGKLRFERDGLWVIGQENDWQNERPQELLDEEEEERERKPAPKSGLASFLSTKRETYRQDHADCKTFKQAETELRKVWKEVSKEEKDEWNRKAKEHEEGGEEIQEGESEAEEPAQEAQPAPEPEPEPSPAKLPAPIPAPAMRTVSPLTFYIQSRRHDYRKECQLDNRRLTLADAATELREIWKTLAKQEKLEWREKLEATQIQKEHPEPAHSPHGSKVEHLEASAPSKNALDEEETETNARKDDSKMKADTVDTQEDEKSQPATTLEFEEEKKEDDCLAKSSSKDIAPESDSASRDSTTAKAIATPMSDSEPNEPTTSEALAPPNESAPSDPTTSESKSSPASDEAAPSNAATTYVAPLIEDSKPVSIPSGPTPTTVISQPEPSKIVKKPSKPQMARKPKKRQPTAQANQRWCMTQEQMELCYEACLEHYESVMRTVTARDLSRELQDGFDVLRERGRGRFDMELKAFDSPVFDFLTDLKKAPWMPVVKTILGDDAVVIHKGCFLSMPGAEPQEYHQDGVHLSTQTQRPCHAINVFVPLVDLHNRNGPTEFCLGSHVLGHEGYDRDFVEIPKPKAGTPVIFDYRLGHRGLGNSSQSCRPIVYCTYARAADGKQFKDSVNFSRKRYHKIGELTEKPLSREARRNKRKRSVESREQEEWKKAIEESNKQETEKKAKLHEDPISSEEEEPKKALEESKKQESEKKAELDEHLISSEEEESKKVLEESKNLEAENKTKLHEAAIAMVI